MACGGSFVRHVLWHRALGHLALNEGHVALELYRGMVSRGGLAEVRDMLNAASLLWRLQDAGQPVQRWMWDELADVAEQRVGEHAWVFADLHYVLSLAGAGRMEALAGMLESHPPLPWQGVTPERIVAGRQLVAHLSEHLDRLPANQRAAVLLRDAQGRDPKEVCQVLDIAEGHLR